MSLRKSPGTFDCRIYMDHVVQLKELFTDEDSQSILQCGAFHLTSVSLFSGKIFCACLCEC